MSLPMSRPWKHPSTGVYYLRQRVPADLTTVAAGKALSLPVEGTNYPVTIGQGVKISLRTKDPATAKQRYREADASLQAYWVSLRNGPVPLSHKEIVALSGLLYSEIVENWDKDPEEAYTWEEFLGAFDRAKAAGNLEGWLGPTVDNLLRDKRINTDGDSRAKLIDAAHDALRQGLNVNKRKAEGDYRPDERAARFPKFKNAQEKIALPAATKISRLFELWEKEHLEANGAVSSVRRWKPVVHSLIAFLGHDDASKVTTRNALGWKDQLLSSGQISVRTFVGVYRAAMSTIFAAGIRNLLITDNPFEQLRVKAPKVIRGRLQGFSNEEANAILRAALDAPTAEGKAIERTRMMRRWVPWLCAYSGARVGEIIQLRKESFQPVEGIQCYWISPDDGPVKDRETRFVPIHSHLIEQGLMDFVGRSSGLLFLNPEATGAAPVGNAASMLAEWVRKDAGIKDRRVQPNHGWRHTFKNIADVAGIAPKYADMICGHELRMVGEKYSDKLAPVLKRELDRFPRYKIGTLPLSDDGEVMPQ